MIKLCSTFKVRSDFSFRYNFELRFHRRVSLSAVAVQRTTHGYRLLTWNPLALCHTSHISGGEEHPLHFMFAGMVACESCWRVDGPGAFAAIVYSGINFSLWCMKLRLSSPTPRRHE